MRENTEHDGFGGEEDLELWILERSYHKNFIRALGGPSMDATCVGLDRVDIVVFKLHYATRSLESHPLER